MHEAYNLEARRLKLKSQIPDLQRWLEMIDILRKQKKEQGTWFLLSDQKILVPPTKTVCLWLGVSVMLEYPLDETEERIRQNVNSVVANFKTVKHD